MSIPARVTVVTAVALLISASAVPAKLAGNTLTADKLFANTLAANTLAASKLAASKVAADEYVLDPASAAGLLATGDGREVLSFIVGCALPASVTLTGTAPDTTVHQFFGEVGLAKSWLRKPLSRVGKGWISACLLARVSNAGVAVALSLRGPHRALAATDDEATTWTLEEGAFYGNLLVPDPEPVVSIACRGEDQAAGEIGGLISRDCTEPDAGMPTQTVCGFTFAGDCGDFAPAQTCRRFSPRGFYKSCHDQPIGPDATKFLQVITVFVLGP